MNRKQGVILSGVPNAKQWTGGDGDGDSGDELQCMLLLNNLISYNKSHPPSVDQPINQQSLIQQCYEQKMKEKNQINNPLFNNATNKNPEMKNIKINQQSIIQQCYEQKPWNEKI